jgi:hypothetical protein
MRAFVDWPEIPSALLDAVLVRPCQNPNRFTLVRLDHDALERLKVGRLVEHVHPADGSVQVVVHKPARGHPRCFWHGTHS